MRVSLKRGSHAVEIEGTLAEVHQILDKWWTFESSSDGDPDDEESLSPKAEVKSGKSRQRKSPRKAENGGTKDTFDPRTIANAIKEDSRFDQFREKIILGNPNRTLRAKFVLWHADAPMTSGQVQKVLQALDVKIDTSTVSRGLSSARSDFITAEGTFGPEYKLTARARAEFEGWLLGA
ncbi:MAG: hypothetical protein DCF29_23940 [Alphaproteobacteria bacterium]|nr:MAG: hypothetical protein DCF29_23940 [Alphaproteobacteria bacterium]